MGMQTCQPLVKENLETHEQKSGDSAKNTENSEILLFFPDQTPFPSRELGTSLIPRDYSPLKMADRRREKRQVLGHKQKSQLGTKSRKYNVFRY